MEAVYSYLPDPLQWHPAMRAYRPFPGIIKSPYLPTFIAGW